MKKIMILGAGIYQVPLIKKANSLGLYTIVVSIPGPYPGFRYADKVYYENTTDYERILEIAKKEAINGITTCGTDVAIKTIGYVCENLNLKGIPWSAAKAVTNKSIMKEKLLESGIACAKSVSVLYSTPIDTVVNHCKSLNFSLPLVVKATDSSGSRGITIIHDYSELVSAVSNAEKVSHSREYLIEEYLDGEEFGADAFVLDGKLQFVLPHGKYVYFAKTGIPVGHYVPYKNLLIHDKTFILVEKCIKSIGLDNCALNLDLMLCDDKPYVIEIGGRSGATCIPELISTHFGYDYYEKIIYASLGEIVDFNPILNNSPCVSAKLLFSEFSGTVTSINLPQLTDDRDVIDLSLDIDVGDKVSEFVTGPDRIGQIVVKSDYLENAERKLKDIVSQIEITMH